MSENRQTSAMSERPKIDPSDPTAIVKEIFDDDGWVKDRFSNAFSAEILKFAENWVNSYKYFPVLDQLSAENEQAAFVAGFVFGVFDDLLVSTKLLVSGKLMASGNLMRQAIEGVAIAALCAANRPIQIPRKEKPPITINYWEHVRKGSDKVKSHLALWHLEVNAAILGVSAVSVRELKKARSRYHHFSHPGMMGIAARMDLGEPGPIFLGGDFDNAKMPGYQLELNQRIGLCGMLPNFVKHLADHLVSGPPR